MLAILCCKANPLSNQLSIVKGICPMVVDHMLRTRDAWKNSIGCGTLSIAADNNDLASLNNFGANCEAKDCSVCLTAIKQQAQSRRGDF